MEKFDINKNFVFCSGLYIRKILYIICILKFLGFFVYYNIIVRVYFMLFFLGFYFDCVLEGIIGCLVFICEIEGDYIVFIVVVNYVLILFFIVIVR